MRNRVSVFLYLKYRLPTQIPNSIHYTKYRLNKTHRLKNHLKVRVPVIITSCVFIVLSILLVTVHFGAVQHVQ